jgi:hypothetical protein
MKRAKTLMRQNYTSNPTSEQYLDAHEMRTLAAACARLIPQPEREPFLGIARTIDFRLAAERGGRWAGSAHFLGAEAFQRGLRGLDELSQARLRRDFADLDALRQDQILASVRRGIVVGESWTQLSPRRFFEELLHEATEIYHTAPVTEEAV